MEPLGRGARQPHPQGHRLERGRGLRRCQAREGAEAAPGGRYPRPPARRGRQPSRRAGPRRRRRAVCADASRGRGHLSAASKVPSGGAHRVLGLPRACRIPVRTGHRPPLLMGPRRRRRRRCRPPERAPPDPAGDARRSVSQCLPNAPNAPGRWRAQPQGRRSCNKPYPHRPATRAHESPRSAGAGAAAARGWYPFPRPCWRTRRRRTAPHA